MFSAHYPVPKCEVERVVTIAFFVMQVVMSNRCEKSKNWVLNPASWKDFIATMCDAITDNLDEHGAYESDIVHWYNAEEYGHEKIDQYGF